MREQSTHSAASRTALSWLAFRALCTLYVASALAAYSLGPVPIQWLSQFGFIGLLVYHVVATGRAWRVPGAGMLVAFLGWSILVNALNAGRFEGMMPAYALLPYWVFVALRYGSVLSFLGAFYVAFWLLWAGYSKPLADWIVRIGMFFAIVAIYIYIAGLVGLPEPPRTRLGTGGFAGQVTNTFSSAGLMFRRAIGTFREPSHLADWLLLPFFISLGRTDTRGRVATIVMALTLLLTVSLQGIISVIVAMTAVTLLTNPFRMENLRRIIGAVAFVSILLVAVGGLSIGALGDGVRVIDVINARTLELTSGGVSATSRSSVMDFIQSHVPPPLGYGFGNASIFASHELAFSVVMSYLSIYAYVLYSTGYVGLALFGLFQLGLVGRAVMRLSTLKELGAGPASVMAFIAYMVSSGAGMEELTVQFGIAAAFAAYEGFARRPECLATPQAAEVAAPDALVPLASPRASMTVRDAFGRLALGRRLIAFCAAVMAIGAVALGLVLKPDYTATASFVIAPSRPVVSAQGGGAGEADAPGPTSDPEFYIELVRSHALLGAVVDSLSAPQHARSNRPDLAAREAAIDRLRKRVVSSLDLPTGIVHLQVSDGSAQLAQRIAERIISELNDYDVQRRRVEAKAERRVLEPRLNETADDLRNTEGALQRFRSANRGRATAPALVTEEGRLRRTLVAQERRFRRLSADVEHVQASESRDMQAVTLVDAPHASVDPDPRRLPTRAIAGLVAGVVIGIGMTLLRRRREEHPRWTSLRSSASATA